VNPQFCKWLKRQNYSELGQQVVGGGVELDTLYKLSKVCETFLHPQKAGSLMSHKKRGSRRKLQMLTPVVAVKLLCAVTCSMSAFGAAECRAR
jgi:hypothetical protein